MANVEVIDATNHIAGRLSSYTAKSLLKGNKVIILNAEKAVLSGDRYMVEKEWKRFLTISSTVNPKHGPFHPRRPDTIITRMVRGMVPRKPKGISAMSRLRVYIGVPEEYQNVKAIEFEDAKIRKPISYYTTLNDLSKLIGWNS